MERTDVARPATRRYALVAGFSLLVLAVLAGLANFVGEAAIMIWLLIKGRRLDSARCP